MTVDPSNQQSTGVAGDRHFILGTAGHIDHGKTSLVRALTGTNTDRLPEERRRGMTIELGFAELVIGNARFGIVDVPGHERFVRTMVAGATGIDLALLVVAANDSVMPQTIEHVEILHFLGISRAIVAITKIDMVEPDMVELVEDEVRELLASTPMRDAVLCPVSSVTGVGIDELTGAIVSACESITTAPAQCPFRMSVDRIFTVQGRGTVATGSVLRGTVREGDSLEVWPGGRVCRVRGLQTHGSSFAALVRGQRAAINISGIDKAHVQRGCELATPGYLQPSRMVDVQLSLSASESKSFKSTSVVRLEIGTHERPVRVVLFGAATLAPGESAFAQLRTGEPVTTTIDQRFIIRDENATRTLGGGVILRPLAQRRRLDLATEIERLSRLESGDDSGRLEEVLRLARFHRPTDLQLCARAGTELANIPAMLDHLRAEKRWTPIPGTDVSVVPAAIDDLLRRLSAWMERFHHQHPDLPGRPVDAVLGYLERMTAKALARPIFDLFIKKKRLKCLGRFACLPAFAPSLSAADEKLLASMIAELRTAGFQPPALANLSVAGQADRKRLDRLATLAVALGELVLIEGRTYLHVEVEKKLRAAVAELIAQDGGAGVAQVREALGSTRKFVVPFLEYLDRVGFTRRTGDERVLVRTQSD